MIELPRITISAPHRSSGKSTVTIGLCAALTAMGKKVQAFKKGPDFIDPMWHEAATGRPSYNLDEFMMGEDAVRKSFIRHAPSADVSVIEGNMGLFDGVDIAGRGEGSGSTAGMARLIKSPVILVIDCYGMNRGIAPLVQGFENFEPETVIAGVILNKVKGSRHERKLRQAIERYCGSRVLGALPHDDAMEISMRHLGLVPAREERGLLPAVGAMSKVVGENVDVAGILEIATAAPALGEVEIPAVNIPEPKVRIGVAMDAAFTFYYPENLEALRAAGAELVAFSPMADAGLPRVDGLYIGGGFPEVHMEALEKNASMREAVREAVESGMAVYAECGGLMYLARSISWRGKTCAMAGALACDIDMSDRPAGHGYVVLRPTGTGPWAALGDEVRAHEFHHSSVRGLTSKEFAFSVVRGKGIDGAHDGIVRKNAVAAYTHIHALATPGWAAAFVESVMRLTGNSGYS